MESYKLKRGSGLLLVAVFLSFALLLSTFGSMASVDAQQNENDEKILVCHRDNNALKPYGNGPLEVSVSAFDGQGGNDHSLHDGPVATSPEHAQQLKDAKTKWGDIVPPIPGVLPDGHNWDEDGMEVWNNGCVFGEVLGDDCEVGPGFAAVLEDSEQGLKKGGASVNADRSNPEDVLGEPDAVAPIVAGFFSLGVEGWVEVSFNGYVLDVEGDDLSFHEATYGNRAAYGEETIEVYVSQDGDNWQSIGYANNHESEGGDGVALLDFSSTGWGWIKYVRVVDATPYDQHDNDADGYDLDAIDATLIECDKPADDEEPVRVVANKVVCVAEEFLPNWGAGGPAITASTAADWVSQSDGNCQLVDWNFQWAGDANNPGDELGEAGGPWVTFSGETEIEDFAGNRIWVREVFDDSWVPFTGVNTTQDYSAELYCDNDVLNYDNYDYLSNVEPGSEHQCVGFNAPAVPDCEIGNTIFMIGDDEVSQTDHPADEFSWTGAFGDFSNPTDDPFVIPFSDTAHFPWNSNTNQGEATDFDVEFYFDGSTSIDEAVLTVAWSPGKTGNETKEVYLDGVMVGSVSRTGTSVGGWYSNMKVFDDTFTLEDLTTGWHTLTFTHPQGDGTLWDFVKLEVSGCDWGNSIQGRKFQDANFDGVFNNAEKQAEGDVNRLDGWDIYLFDDEWTQVDMMTTGDDGTAAGNVQKGQYRFVDVAPGTYYVCEMSQNGWMQTRPDDGPYNEALESYCFEVVVEGFDNQYNGYQFGNFELGVVRGMKFEDTNGDGQMGDDEEYIKWGYEVFDDEWQEVGEPEADVALYVQVLPELTPWNVDGLLPGTYYVCEYAVEGWVQTSPSSDEPENVIMQEVSDELAPYCYVVVIDESGDDETALFGNYEAIGQISGLVYNDVSNNSDQDPEENGMIDWQVWLLTKNSPYTIKAIATTDADGGFLFDSLPFGTYYVCQDLQEGWLQTQLNQAGSGGVDQAEHVVGDILDLDDADVDEFCYTVEITADNPVAEERDFGNYFAVLGETIDVRETDDEDEGGNVLGATSPEVLAETGDPVALTVALGLTVAAIAILVGFASRTRLTRQ